MPLLTAKKVRLGTLEEVRQSERKPSETPLLGKAFKIGEILALAKEEGR